MGAGRYILNDVLACDLYIETVEKFIQHIVRRMYDIADQGPQEFLWNIAPMHETSASGRPLPRELLKMPPSKGEQEAAIGRRRARRRSWRRGRAKRGRPGRGLSAGGVGGDVSVGAAGGAGAHAPPALSRRRAPELAAEAAPPPTPAAPPNAARIATTRKFVPRANLVSLRARAGRRRHRLAGRAVPVACSQQNFDAK
ncbi:hypothetical protein EVAR_6457_1 [Eumeta japonica]|uniref:Uncharacterized protein n=1 Tax=Eumeta variegata TaxID=151549 RepID=A0A4C1SQG5_EUMVA|nr:hypothetical protein EVAR_6457_1 [Eumeta japonica]